MKRDSVERKKTVSVCESEEVLVVLAETSQHTSLFAADDTPTDKVQERFSLVPSATLLPLLLPPLPLLLPRRVSA